ncbi:uncharacterized protein BDW70DRAFT_162773 [Aspergillus foveolatus]|uniref:uncharacterized protein n=1 Tax=Aspergillus foveolatus TaxID=210207 RepID=UPI003CCD6CAC
MSLTTPFNPPPDCSIQDLTTITATSHSTAETVPVLLSDPADPRFTECQPSNWASAPSSSRFSYSPAVCPSDWLAWSIATTELQAETVTTAWCCHTGYTLEPYPAYILPYMTQPCIRTILPDSTPSLTITATLSHGTGPTTPFTSGIALHAPWHITWKESDRALLSPQPPILSASETIRYWVPGEAVDEPNTNVAGDEGGMDERTVLGLGLGIGLGGGLVLVAGVVRMDGCSVVME